MSAMYRLKAYFGMVPAEELGDYADSGDDHGDAYDRSGYDRYPVADRHPGERAARLRDSPEWEERFTYEDEPPVERPRVGEEWERRTSARSETTRGPVPGMGGSGMGGSGLGGSGLGPAAVRGALAVDPDTVARPSLVPVPPAVPEQRDRASGPTRITTLQPASYKEARTIGEHYREGQPVIMNLTELDAADAKRLVDFAAGLAFALRGSIDKVTNRVFLLTPADVEVSADDARRIAQRGAFRPE